VGDFLSVLFPGKTLWLSEPTWDNHPKVFEAAGVPLARYAYFDKAANGLDFAGMIAALKRVPRGDCVLLHACCHNPTGADPSLEQWQKLSELMAERQLIPLVDFAYQGFGAGLEEDAAGLRALAERNSELFVCSSFSKNFGLYNERVGALTVVGKTAEHAQSVLSQLKVRIRTNYSNPPAHGGEVVRTILADAVLRSQWVQELTGMRTRIRKMRELLVKTLKEQGAGRDFSFVAQQNGMFSFSGLNKEQVEVLRDRQSIYIVGSGRINVAGITPKNLTPLCQAIVSVL
jgi:aspartate/tyrosine/aromatic aminotransferase